jgi:CRP/FNR family transcriptional regulator, cyclic AMP receptor protein
MTAESLLVRFQGEEGARRLEELVRAQVIAAGNAAVGAELSRVAAIREVAVGEVLIRQDASDNDLFLILSGAFRIVVNGRDVAIRRAREHLGEMAIVDPSSPRTAHVIAAEESIVACLREADVIWIANRYPDIWRAIALQLSRRLTERKRFHQEPNVKPVIFIGSSKERLRLAEAVAALIPQRVADVKLWSTGVFSASHFVMDDLDAQLRICDFAVLVAGPDDQVTSRGKQSDAPRDNVVFELGLCMGALSRFRTFLLVPKGQEIKIPSDLLGLTLIHFDAAATDPVAAVAGSVDEILALVEKQGPK